MSAFNLNTNIPTSGLRVITIRNDGTAPGGIHEGKPWNYSNQCFWISVLEGLSIFNIKNKPPNILYLRAEIQKRVGSGNINKGDELFDTQKYHDCLIALTNRYKIKLNIYEVQRDKTLIRKLWTIGDEYNNVVNIAFSGNHFEYIVQIDDNPSYSSYDVGAVGRSYSSSITTSGEALPIRVAASSSRSSPRLSTEEEREARIKYLSNNNKKIDKVIEKKKKSSCGFNSNSSLMNPSRWN